MGGALSRHRAAVPDLPYQDSREHFRRRLAMLSSANDQIYRQAYREYITSANIDDFKNVELIMFETKPPHQIVIRGDVYDKRYMIIEKFSVDRYTSVWLAADLNTYTRKMTPSCEQVMIMFARADIHYSLGARRAIELTPVIRQALAEAHIPRSHSPVVRIFRDFRFPGMGGEHLAVVTERVRCDLRALLGRALPVPSVRLVARDMLRALDFLHTNCGVVHTDVHPGSIFVTGDPVALKEGRHRDLIDEAYTLEGYLFPLPVVKLDELGTATNIAAPAVLAPIGTIHYRAPELLLGMHYNTALDIWALGCTLFEALTGAKLIDPDPFRERGLSETESLLACMTKVFGGLPSSLAHLPLAVVYFNEEGRFRRCPDLETYPIRNRLHDAHGYSHNDAIAIENFLLPMLQIDPERRVHARDHLSHAWLQTALLIDHVQYRVPEPTEAPSLEFNLRRTFSSVFD